jgi:hypothetical protein
MIHGFVDKLVREQLEGFPPFNVLNVYAQVEVYLRILYMKVKGQYLNSSWFRLSMINSVRVVIFYVKSIKFQRQ